MRNKRAYDIFDESVEVNMKANGDETTECTQEYLHHTRKLLHLRSTDPVRRITDLTIVELRSAQQWFNRWLDQLRNDYPERSQRGPHFISWQTHEDINLTVNGFCGLIAHLCQPSFTSQHFAGHFIIPKRLSQDIIESHFSQQRGGCGGNQNMTAYAYSYNNQRLMCTRVARKNKRKDNAMAAPQRKRHKENEASPWRLSL